MVTKEPLCSGCGSVCSMEGEHQPKAGVEQEVGAFVIHDRTNERLQ